MLNARALTKKMDEWFNDSITTPLVYVDGYEIVREDGNNRHGRGVCIFNKSRLVVENFQLTNPCNNFDVIAIFKTIKSLFRFMHHPV